MKPGVVKHENVIDLIIRPQQSKVDWCTCNWTDSETMRTAAGTSRCSLLNNHYGSPFIILKKAHLYQCAVVQGPQTGQWLSKELAKESYPQLAHPRAEALEGSARDRLRENNKIKSVCSCGL